VLLAASPWCRATRNSPIICARRHPPQPRCSGASSQWRDLAAQHVNLARQLPIGGRIRKAEPLTKKVYFHLFVVSSPGDLDDEFALLMYEARDVGDGQFRTP
jgi:hypothetical protein